MLMINKNYTTSIFDVTVSEKSTVLNPSYRMVLESKENNTTYSFNLPENTSDYLDRYDRFVMINNNLPEMPTGFYIYEIFQVSDNIDDVSVEDGLLKVINPDNSPEFVYIEPDESEDDYFGYNPDEE